MDNDQKLVQLLETIGDGVDVEFAQEVLAANGYDLQAALDVILGGGAPAAAPAAETDADDVRAPMRTGYMDTLMAPEDPAEIRRQEAEREAERKRLEAERAEQEAQRQREELRQFAERQRQDAERLALEAKKQKMKAEEEQQQTTRVVPKLLAPSWIDDDDDLDDLEPCGGGMGSITEMNSRPSAQEAPQVQVPVPPPEPPAAPAPEEPQPPPPEPQQESSLPLQEQQAAAASAAEALRALRKRYREADPAALATCLRTLSAYIGNLAKNPQEPKFQRINCENAAFRTRVGNLEGAIAVLEACGFKSQDGVLEVDAEFARSRACKDRLWDAQAKLDVMIGDLKNAGF
eukprot:TRINITY_DN82130_c0_g1_i1.p1 TRINITY_DN82130_c0_g1~~TRINITY_DN82130_c0_g1_i1.p1  ORF type:complete len:347 (+),score=123.24 TRINITY_DN82130_c0_g1_i1:44-1084(+)